MDRFKYKPLDEKNAEIRVLRLLPGIDTDPLQGELITVQLSTELQIEFEALSYVWGTPANPGTITLRQKHIDGLRNEHEESGVLAISKNLYEALPYLRFSDDRRFLWIDAICIDQSNVKERSSQVQKMAQIFKTAVRVIMWLGLPTPRMKIALDKITEFGSLWQYSTDSEQLTVIATSAHGKTVCPSIVTLEAYNLLSTGGRAARDHV